LAGINTKLDANQVLKQAYDEPNQRLRVDASISASIGDVTIVDPDGDPLNVNPDGSINVQIAGGGLQVEISAADGDNIAISDGTNTAVVNVDGSLNVNLVGTSEVRITDGTDDLAINADGSINSNVSATDLDIRDLAFATDKVDVTGSNVGIQGTVTVQATDLDIRNLQFAQDSVDVTGSVVTETNSADILTELQSIDSKLPTLGPQTEANSVSVTLASDIGPLEVNVELNAFTNTNPDNVQLVGSIDGTATGAKYGIVNNIRLQILNAHDRVQDITYADFGTKNQRITEIDYTSSVFPGIIARKTLTYMLVGTKYRRDSITWSII
jgi:hypothetical protein